METLLTSSRVCLPVCMQHCHVKLSTYYWMSLKSNLFVFARSISIQVFLSHTNFSLFFPPSELETKKAGREGKRIESSKIGIQFNLRALVIATVLHIHFWPVLSQTKPIPAQVNPALTWPTVKLISHLPLLCPPKGLWDTVGKRHKLDSKLLSSG